MTADFSKGSISANIIRQAVPLTLAQLVQLLYNIVDRIYIGRLPDAGDLALTGVGLAFPLITITAAFTNLFGTGGTPLFSIARGHREDAHAEKIMGNTFCLLLGSSVFLFLFGFLLRKPLLYLFGAGDDSYVYADAYLKVYLLGTPCSMLATGMNGFINAQGFPGIGMLTTVIGAVLNLILDPLFIFGLHMGVQGAALATVISQAVSGIWVIRFLASRQSLLRIRKQNMKLEGRLVREIVSLGTSGFIVQATNALVQIVCNISLQEYGGDLYVGIMTVLHSIREVLSLPVMGLTSGSQPVLGYNYGARQFSRVKEGIRFTALIGTAYTFLAWGLVMQIPHLLFSVFTKNTAMAESGTAALQIYFFGFCFMAFQFSGQCTFQALGYARRSIFFSLLRKAVIVVPLTLLLPAAGFGVNGVFLAEPVSNIIGGLACFTAMWLTVYRRLGGEPDCKSAE
ncbi:MAG: MATE family efflux transporter [Eubacterium sp.]|jgi:putative MATE family efflux protein|nr:MATE family efflux transporter [Eubacterium sp.]